MAVKTGTKLIPPGRFSFEAPATGIFLGFVMDGNGRWIKSYEKIFESEIWLKPNEWIKIWIWLLHHVNWKDGSILKRGQGLFTHKFISEACSGTCSGSQVSAHIVKHFLDWAKRANMIHCEQRCHKTMITICNYEKYQSCDHEKSQQPTLQPTLPPAIHQPSSGHPISIEGYNSRIKNIESRYGEKDEAQKYVTEKEPEPKKLVRRKKEKRGIPDDFVVTERHRLWAIEHKAATPEDEIERFKDYWRAKGEKMADWDAAFRNWLRRAKDWRRGSEKTTEEKKIEQYKKDFANFIA